MCAKVLFLDGESLTPDSLCHLADDVDMKIDLTKDAWNRVAQGRQVIEEIIASGKVVYGINTGFGNFSQVKIDSKKLNQLQVNLIRSHCAGVGDPLPRARTRMLVALRVNVFCKGHSGIRVETVKRIVAAFNAGCIPVVPEKGTVGASGDLAPLSHLALGFMGEGDMWDPDTQGQQMPAKCLLERLNLHPIELHAKEGLAMINGTTLITSLGSEALVRAFRSLEQANIVASLSLEAMRGTVSALNPRIHAVRPHRGQGLVARHMRSLLHREGHRSTISESHHACDKVQDSYTLRCVPQVHGIVYDTLVFVKQILGTELNSATDNPMVFYSEEFPLETKKAFEMHRVSDGSRFTISGGNFHGEYPAKACDYLSIAMSEIANMSERRIERLVNPALSNGLPAFLTEDGGLNSGFMIAHCTAAALVSENKALAYPASVDSISTSAGQEDHVSMGGWAARKALLIADHVETVLAIELLCACQGIDFLRNINLRTTPALEEVYALVRSHVPHMGTDRVLSGDIAKVKALLRRNEIADVTARFTSHHSAL